MSEQDERFVPMGNHLIHIDGDTVVFVARGTVTAPDVRELLVRCARIKDAHGCLFALYDGRHSSGIDAEARKVSSEERPANTEADLQVAFGVSFAIRVTLNMVIHAQKVLRNRIVPIRIFEKEIEARSYFEAEREKIRKKKGVKPSL